MNSKDEMVNIINGMAGRHSAYQIFSDFVECSAIAIQNACFLTKNELWKKREEQYVAVIRKYEADEVMKMQSLFCTLGRALEENIEDVLGYVFMKSGCGSQQLGQFFTPFHLSRLVSELGVQEIKDGEIYHINEPSCGGGGMIIGAAAALNEAGMNYQKILRVTAQDLDWKGVYMTYVQLSLLGINATVIQGDTLSDEYVRGVYPDEKVFRTPAAMGVLI